MRISVRLSFLQVAISTDHAFPGLQQPPKHPRSGALSRAWNPIFALSDSGAPAPCKREEKILYERCIRVTWPGNELPQNAASGQTAQEY